MCVQSCKTPTYTNAHACEHTPPCPHLIVNLLTVLQRCRQQGQQAVGACLWVSVQVGQGLLALRLDVGQGPTGTLVGQGQT